MWRGLVVVAVASGVATGFALACGASYDEEARVADASLQPDAPPTVDSGAPPLQCGDPGSQCVVAPSGWLVVSFGGLLDGDAGPAVCPPYFTDGRVLVENVRTDGGTCACSCTSTSKPCNSGQQNLDIRTDGVNCNDYVLTVVADGTCKTLPANWAATSDALLGNAPSNGQMTCSSTNVLPPALDDGRSTICTSPPPAPCSEGACVAAPAEVTTCVLRDGTHECPAPYTTRRLVFAETQVNDTRACEACTCTPQPVSCTNRQIVFFQDPACGGVGAPVGLPAGPCTVVPNLGTAKAYRYDAVTDGGGCAPSPASPAITGSLALPPAQTLCCK